MHDRGVRARAFAPRPAPTCSASCARPIWRDFSLRARGLEVLEAAPDLNVFRDGARLTLHDDDRETARELARFDARDARGLPALPRRAGRDRATCSARGSTGRRPGARAGSAAIRSAPSAAALGAARRHGLAAAKLFATSARDHLEQRFRSEHVGAALGWDAISNTLAGPSTPGTAYSLLHEHAAASLGGVAWGFVRGGMGRSPRLLADAAAEAGAEIVTGAPVERILVDGRPRARGASSPTGGELAAAARGLERRPEADPARARRRATGSTPRRPRRSRPTAARARA